ncbi:hypothetical protein LOTGIDRAFT_237767 [Lottia gigantea]|uniref:CARD domain-containing protein n=1 Tax=Lottia gigantea TaxID=225164 RepID=V4AZS1_LOTGI|nr:hypothetical protein LOTGIDRAFT_237767 [Lottia gigantea]ESP03233.1 hypothetical protein LOTGIDRAFT_237767 [Lottia gigantea]
MDNIFEFFIFCLLVVFFSQLQKNEQLDSENTGTTKQRGSWSEVEFEVLNDNHERLVKELDSKILLKHIFHNNLINKDEMERIRQKEEELRKEIVGMIFNFSGANAYPKLLKSLADAGYNELSSTLESDLKQKKEEMIKHAFPDYPFPQLVIETTVLKWQQNITQWKEKGDAGKLWCVAMNNWFKNHEFKSKKELKFVVKRWLGKLKEVVDRGCLEIDKINIILRVTELLLVPEIVSNMHLNDISIFIDILKNFVPDYRPTMNSKELFQTKTAERRRLLAQQRQVFKILKYNLEGIVEGKQKFELLTIDSNYCELAKYFDSVVNDVKKWNKLHQSI